MITPTESLYIPPDSGRLVLVVAPVVDARISEKGVAGRADDGTVFQFDLDGLGFGFDIFYFHDTVVH